MNQSCPTADHVEAFAFGTLEPDQVDTLSEHLDSCGACRTAYESILSNTDPIVAGLRAGGANEGDSRVRALAAKLQRIPYEQPLNPPEPDVETSAVAEETAEFDPLHVWLGIPAEEQPADHYRLLGLRRFEHSLEVIESAADRQMMHLRSFQAGKRSEFAQTVLNQVSTARICLLNPDKKKAYDQQLKEEAGASQSEAPAKIDLPIEPPQTIDELRHLVTSLGLLSDTKFDKYLAKLPPDEKPTNAETLARRLVADGRLTKHQAATLYQGKWQKLVLGDYTLLARIGGGGMGDVYRALHRRMGVVRAIKVIKSELVDSPDTVQRFHREVLAAAQLTHQHIVMAYDASEDQGRHYLVMEYIDGPDLGSLVKQKGPLSVPRTIDFIIQAARGLAHAHSKGTIHRDVKPGNLLLGSDGIVKVSDLGLARLDPDKSDVDEQNHLTTSDGKILGTVDFMAPEQADNTHTADERADIYSLGCTLYRLLTGASPYGKGSTLNRMMAHRNAPIPKIRDKRPEISEQLDKLFARLVAKRPEDRPQSMEEVEQLLEACLEGGEVPLASPQPVPVGTSAAAAQVRPLPLEKPLAAVVQPRINTQAAARQRLDLRKLLRSRAGITGLAIGLALLLFGGAALTIMLTIQTPEGEFIVEVDGQIAPDVKIELKQGGEVIEVASAKNGWKLSVNQGEYQLAVQGGNDQFQLNKYVASVKRDAKEIVRLTKKQNTSTRNYALAFEGKGYVELPLKYPGGPIAIEAIVVPTETQMQAIVSSVSLVNNSGIGLGLNNHQQWHIRAIDAPSEKPPNSLRHVWSDDVAETTRVHLSFVFDSEQLRLFVNGIRQETVAATRAQPPSSQSPFFIGCTGEKALRFHGTIDEVRISNIARYTDDYTPQERLEADEHTLALYHFDEGTGDKLIDSSGNNHRGKIHGAKWVRVSDAPSSSGSEAESAEQLDPPAAAPDQIVEVRRFEGHTGPVKEVSISRNGQHILSVSGWPDGDRSARLWDVASGKELRRFVGHTGQVISGKNSRDHEIVITGSKDESLRVWDLSDGGEQTKFRFQATVQSVAVTPDRSFAVVGLGRSAENSLAFVDLRKKEIDLIPGHSDVVQGVCCSIDGNRAFSCGFVRRCVAGISRRVERYIESTPRMDWRL